MKIRDAWFYPFIVIVALSVGYHADQLWIAWIHKSLDHHTPGPTSIDREAPLEVENQSGVVDTWTAGVVEVNEPEGPSWTIESITITCGQCGQVIPVDPDEQKE